MDVSREQLENAALDLAIKINVDPEAVMIEPSTGHISISIKVVWKILAALDAA